jgi:copper chaperone
MQEEDITMTILSVPDMSCGHCKATVESALGAVPQVGAVTVDLTARRVEVTGPATAAQLLQALDQAGYPATVA